MTPFPFSQSQRGYTPPRPIKVGVLGATGAVGQRFVQLLEGHPWFQVTALGASGRAVGKTYGAAAGWRLSADVPEYARDITMVEGKPGPEWDCDIIFTSLPAEIAGEVEEEFAAAGYKVFSNSRNHRYDPDVPLMIPEVNPDHSNMLAHQQKGRGWERGFIVTNPNCTTIHLVLALKPLQDAFGLKKVIVTTMQAVSGAGYPGVPSLDVIDNVMPHSFDEEEKVESEPLKIMGRFEENDPRFEEALFAVSATCTRVAVREGHTESVAVELGRTATIEEVAAALTEFEAEPQRLKLPSAPLHPVVLRTEAHRPQVLLDRDSENAMATVVGRLQKCKVLDYRFLLIGHNTIRGAAGASILNAELLAAQGLII
ncbi:MAG: aspartate-semialdehyde dehydrogenase [Chloroflexota bacterium]|nr:aspartate-semialdehyde dehydrogenase [Chloroflexota bacterium]